MKMFDQSVNAEDLLLLAKADHMGRAKVADYSEIEHALKEHLEVFWERMSRPFVRGADLVAAGINPGPQFGEALAYSHKMRLAGVDKESALRQTLAFLNKK